MRTIQLSLNELKYENYFGGIRKINTTITPQVAKTQKATYHISHVCK